MSSFVRLHVCVSHVLGSIDKFKQSPGECDGNCGLAHKLRSSHTNVGRLLKNMNKDINDYTERDLLGELRRRLSQTDWKPGMFINRRKLISIY